MKQLLLSIATLLITSSTWSSGNAVAMDLMIEADPMPYLFAGQSKAIAIKPDSSGHWALWAAEFEMELPTEMINLDKKNKDLGFDHKITASRGVAVDYMLSPDLTGYYFGLGRFVIHNEVTLEEEKQAFAITYNFVRVGYYWVITGDFLFHLWVSVGPQSITSGSSDFTGQSYNIESYRILGGPHFSYKF